MRISSTSQITASEKSAQTLLEAITNRLLDTIDLLEETPLIGPLHHDPVLQSMGYRKLLCGQYVCIYRIVDGIPIVYRVFHESQNYTADFLWEM